MTVDESVLEDVLDEFRPYMGLHVNTKDSDDRSFSRKVHDAYHDLKPKKGVVNTEKAEEILEEWVQREKESLSDSEPPPDLLNRRISIDEVRREPDPNRAACLNAARLLRLLQALQALQ